MNELNSEIALIQDTEKFKKSLSMSNKAVFVIIVFLLCAYLFIDKPILLPVGSALIAAGGLYIILYIIRNRIIKGEIPPKEDSLHYFKYWINQYENTHKLARSIFWWYLLPVVPGFIAFTIGMAQLIPDKAVFVISVLGSMALIVGGGVFWLNRYYASGKLQARIDSLNSFIAKLESNGN